MGKRAQNPVRNGTCLFNIAHFLESNGIIFIEFLIFLNCDTVWESDGEDVLSTTIQKGKRSGLTLVMEHRFGMFTRSSAAAEKIGEGMALKICTRAKPFLKACIKPFDITEIGRLPMPKEKG